jgi:predicted trehalose synthase
LNSRLFIIALKQFRLASPEAIMSAYDEMLSLAGDSLKIGKALRARRTSL